MELRSYFLQEAREKTAEVEAAGRKAQEENARLQDHIHDLETRKRAPLYQKKQEEELRAATEKAQEAEGRALEAEARAKEAKVSIGYSYPQQGDVLTEILYSQSYDYKVSLQRTELQGALAHKLHIMTLLASS